MVKQVDIPNPTFPLICFYETSKDESWHVDLYNLEAQEVPALGLEEHWREGITMIEWPERLPLFSLAFLADDSRNIRVLCTSGFILLATRLYERAYSKSPVLK
jgi:tRNA A37 threonylcarbamoyladenosine biosynthesis protein TsaE